MEYDADKNETETQQEVSKEQVVTKQSLSSHQVITKLSPSIPNIVEMLQKMITPIPAKEMRSFCGLKDSSYFKKNVIDPLIAANLIDMTQPDKPKSPTQKYYLTEQGKALLCSETQNK